MSGRGVAGSGVVVAVLLAEVVRGGAHAQLPGR